MTQKNITEPNNGHGQSRSTVASTARETARNIASEARAELDARVTAKKEEAGEGLSSVADALRGTRDELRDRSPMIGEYTEQAAQRIEELSELIRTKSTREIVDGVERFARREPALFFGGAFVVGLLAARFLKSAPVGGSGSESFGEPMAFEGGPTYETVPTTTPGADDLTPNPSDEWEP
jgi:hypothetical protein